MSDEHSYSRFKDMQPGHKEYDSDQLRRLIEAGISSPGVPAEEAFARLRAVAEELSINVKTQHFE